MLIMAADSVPSPGYPKFSLSESRFDQVIVFFSYIGKLDNILKSYLDFFYKDS